MPYIAYEQKTFQGERRAIISKAHEILVEYAAQGYDLTLRQLYYQFVARGWIPNTDRDYKRLGSIVSDARMAGKIDWHHIVDRTRYVRESTFWESPAQIIRASANGFRLDKWETQRSYVEVWVEKDALIGVVEQACRPLETAYLSCRGYVSASEMWRAAQRVGERIRGGQNVVLLHLGDHDPSGIDMTRDIQDRILHFVGGDATLAAWNATADDSDEEWNRCIKLGTDAMNSFEVKRIALNWDQIEEYGPPPNPAKITDSRARGYMERFGRESWELDALEPRVLTDLITDEVLGLRDLEAWAEIERKEQEQGAVLRLAHEQWDAVAAFLNEGREDDE